MFSDTLTFWYLRAANSIIGNPTRPPGYIAANEGAATIKRALDLTAVLSAIISTFFIIYAGIHFILSGGDPGRIKQAMSSMQWAITGLIISIAAYLMVGIIAGVLGVGSLELPF